MSHVSSGGGGGTAATKARERSAAIAERHRMMFRELEEFFEHMISEYLCSTNEL
jgi:hypothetical protein